MNVENDLLKLYDGWRTLTLEERRAITTADWATVAEVQQEKRLLQDRAAELREQLLSESSPEAIRSTEERLHKVLAELITLEKENAEILGASRSTAQAEEAALNRSCRSLKQVRNAYSSGRRHAWHSYS